MTNTDLQTAQTIFDAIQLRDDLSQEDRDFLYMQVSEKASAGVVAAFNKIMEES